MCFPDLPAPVTPHPDYPADVQSAYLVRGDGLTANGVSEGMFLTVIDRDAAGDGIKSGAVVVVEHLRLGGTEIEVSARELQYYPDRTEFRSLSSFSEVEPIVLRNGSTDKPDGKAVIRGLVIAATMVF